MGFDGLMLNEHHSTPFCMGGVMNVEAAILARITKREDRPPRQRPADLGRPALAGRDARRDRHDLARPPGHRLGARHRPRERRPQRAAALQLGALPGGARLRHEGVDHAGPVPLGGRALPLPLREPVGAALPEAASADLDSRRAQPQHGAVVRPQSHPRTSCSPPSSSPHGSRSSTTTRWRASTATRPAPSTAATCSRCTSTRPRSWRGRPGASSSKVRRTSSSKAAGARSTRSCRTCRA